MELNGRDAWERNAPFWDAYMGDESNDFHRRVVRPAVEEFLAVGAGDRVLDIACGNGNFSARMAEQGATVVAFDYSAAMIGLAQKRRRGWLHRIRFSVCDGADEAALLELGQGMPFDKAVCCMALMDMAQIAPLFRAVYAMLAPGGVFVAATHHPCFTYPAAGYLAPCTHQGEAIKGQPVLQNYYHRSIQDILAPAFGCGFVVDALREIPLPGEVEPIVLTLRLRKAK